MFGWRLPMGRVRFAIVAALCVLAMPLTGSLGPWFAAPIRWLPDHETRVIVGLVMTVFVVALWLLSATVLLVSTARRLKDMGATRWLTPLSLGAEWVLRTPRLFDPAFWSHEPMTTALVLAMIVWMAILALTPGRAARRRPDAAAAEFT